MTQGDSDSVTELEHRLVSNRPVPAPGFRGELRRRVAADPERFPRHGRARLAIAAYAGSGSALLAIAAIGVLGAGPFAAG